MWTAAWERAGSARIIRQTARPSRPGSTRSSNTRSGRKARASAIAAAPSATARTSTPPPSRSAVTSSRMTGSSSTTRIRKPAAMSFVLPDVPSAAQPPTCGTSGPARASEAYLHAQGPPSKGERMGIIAWIVFGFVIGLIARALVPGKQGMGLVMTTLLGVTGSLVGGLVASALGGGNVTGFQPSGFIGSLIGAVVLLVVAGMVMRPRHRTV